MNSNKKRILVVYDKTAHARLLKLYLEQSNFLKVREENDPNALINHDKTA